MTLADRACKPCRGGVPPLSPSQYAPLLKELKGWRVENKKRLRKTLKTGDFMESLELANRIGQLAEEVGHHPDLTVRWGELSIELWTHKIDGLTEADFVLAAKIDRLI